MTKPNDTTLTADELQALQYLLEAVEAGRDRDARWWLERHDVVSALAKMRAQAAEAAKGVS